MPTCSAAARPATTGSRPRGNHQPHPDLRSATTATRPAPGSRPSSTTPGSPATAPRVTTAPARGGKSATHIKTSTTCESCHVIAAWQPASRVDHAQVLGTCFSCHDGTVATGKNATHIPSDNACEQCHTTTPVAAGQFLAHRPDRSLLRLPRRHTGDRQERHPHPLEHVLRHLPRDLLVAAGHAGRPHPGERQLRVVPQRHDGHRQERRPHRLQHRLRRPATRRHAWKPVTRVDHAQVTGTCFSCHDGTKATGKTPTHIPSDNTCDNCHSPLAWKPARFDHTGITNNCASCHNGVKAQGKRPRISPAATRAKPAMPWRMEAGNPGRSHPGDGTCAVATTAPRRPARA